MACTFDVVVQSVPREGCAGIPFYIFYIISPTALVSIYSISCTIEASVILIIRGFDYGWEG